jgi:hypothetical protein
MFYSEYYRFGLREGRQSQRTASMPLALFGSKLTDNEQMYILVFAI